MSKRVIKGSSQTLPESGHHAPKLNSRIIPRNQVLMERPAPEGTAHVHAPKPTHETSSEKAGHKPTSPHRKNMPVTALGINQMVEEKVKEFEERFQQEKEQAFNTGISQGEARGLREGLKSVEKIEKLFNKILTEFKQEKENFFKEAEGSVAKLSLEIAEAIIGEAASKGSEEILQHNLKRCLDSLKSSGKVKVRISPLDYDFARTHTRLTGQNSDDNCSLEFEPDPSISPGGCYLETVNGAIDGRLESQFEIMKDNFLQLA